VKNIRPLCGKLFRGGPPGEQFFEPPPLTAVQKEGFLCVLYASAVNMVFLKTTGISGCLHGFFAGNTCRRNSSQSCRSMMALFSS
jgi:hypothetical protein